VAEEEEVIESDITGRRRGRGGRRHRQVRPQ